jgi:hypothetical protein
MLPNQNFCTHVPMDPTRPVCLITYKSWLNLINMSILSFICLFHAETSFTTFCSQSQSPSHSTFSLHNACSWGRVYKQTKKQICHTTTENVSRLDKRTPSWQIRLSVNTMNVRITSPNWLASRTFQLRSDDWQTLEADTELCFGKTLQVTRCWCTFHTTVAWGVLQ